MKLKINQGVRDTLAELDAALARVDEVSEKLADRGLSDSDAMRAGYDKRQLESIVVGIAARLISHASEGRRYPHMVEGSYRADRVRKPRPSHQPKSVKLQPTLLERFGSQT